MHLHDEPQSLYDVLELTPDATPQEIRSAYLRLKSSYGKDNVAHYSMFSREETEALLGNIESAYLVLSNPERRKSYDQNQGFKSTEGTGTAHSQDFSNSSNLASMTISSWSGSPQASSSQDSANSDLEAIIQSETEWSGAAIKRIREARRISVEDLADYTRISRTYLQAVEDEDFNKIPAMVYVRGFIQQISKRLKLPADRATQTYLARIKSARPNKL